MPTSDTQRRLRRSKQSERDAAKWLLEHDGPDPKWSHITSSTGRVGFITGLQFDAVSINYVLENKQVKVPARLFKWWLQINQIAVDRGKDALLRLEPTNIQIGVPAALRKKVSALHIITDRHHAELLDARAERDFLQLRVNELEGELDAQSGKR